jgi:ketosteroid isomerase-like protein
VDPKKPAAGPTGNSPSPDSQDELALNSTVDEFFHRLRSDMRRPLPSQEAIASALQAMQRLAAESVADAGTTPSGAARSAAPATCQACGHQNRPGNQFCGMCGLPLELRAASASPEVAPFSLTSPSEPAALPNGQHHYHHHYHHHYFPSGHDLGAGNTPRAVSADTGAAKLRSPGAGLTMSRVEAAVRKVIQDWTFACNSRQLDDLVSTYASDALVLRPNHPAVRGTAAIREFFFATLDAGLGEVELDLLRLDVIGDVAYEAGRCKMLVPVVVGKRREERGKYLTVLARQANGEWRIVCDCWSSDLSLSGSAEGDPSKPGALSSPAPKPAPPRKTS